MTVKSHFNIDQETGFLFFFENLYPSLKNNKEGVTCVHMHHLNQFNKALSIFLDQKVLCLGR